jgi:PAS domain S-box-containing protein
VGSSPPTSPQRVANKRSDATPLFNLKERTLTFLGLAHPQANAERAPAMGDLDTRVRRELLNLVYNDQPFSLGVAWLYAAAITGIFSFSRPSALPWFWLAGMTAILGCRFVLALGYRRLLVPDGSQLPVWERRLFVGATVTGIWWGALALYAYPIATPVIQGAVLLLIGGVVAATSRTLGCQLRAFAVYGITASGPLVTYMLIQRTRESLLLGIFGICFIAMMVAVARSFRDTMGRSFRLRFENADLANQLQHDIAGREAAEAALRASEERLRFAQFALDHAQDMVAILDRNGRLLHANDALCRHTHRTMAELSAMKAWDGMFAFDAEHFEARWDEISRSGAMTFETEVVSREGTRMPVEINASYVEFNGRAAVCTIARDLVPRRAAEEEKIRLLQQLQETQKLESLGVLAGGVAHDFNNLLTAILANATLARESADTPAATAEMLGQIEHAATQAAGLCRQMLAYAGKGQLVVEPLDLSALVSGTGKLLEMTVSRRAHLELRLEPGLPSVRGDASQIRQIVLNLVHNAAEAIARRDGLIVVATARIRITRDLVATSQVRTALPDGDGVVLTVSDNGSGMDATTLERIFEPFFTTKFTGRGLGLAAVLGIVRSHHGLLHVETKPGHGSRFQLILPVVAQPAPKRPSAPILPAAKQGRVLVIDDEETVRNVARQTLQRVGYEVDTAVDGDAALAALADSSPYDVILVDMTMPGRDGIATLREMRRRGVTAPAMLMSGFSEQQIRPQGEAEGVAEFLQKPFDCAALRAKVDAVIHARSPAASAV